MGSRKQITDGSSGIQADGNVTINNYGMTLAEVREIFDYLFNENFPKMQALRRAYDNVLLLFRELEAQFPDRYAEIDPDKFKDPDVQFTLNDAVRETAKRGDAANIDLLVNLIFERVSKDNSDLLDLTCSEAIKIVPRLTRPQIDLLSVVLLLYFEYNSVANITAVSDYEPIFQMAHPLVKSASGLSRWDMGYLETHRCLIRLFGMLATHESALRHKVAALKNTESQKIRDEVRNTTKYVW